MTLSFFPFRYKDWLASQMRATLPALPRLVYMELFLCCCAEGSLPTDENALAGISKVSLRELRKAWPAIREKFIERDGRYVNLPAVSVFEGVVSTRKKQSDSGRESAAKRSRSVHGDRYGDRDANRGGDRIGEHDGHRQPLKLEKENKRVAVGGVEPVSLAREAPPASQDATERFQQLAAFLCELLPSGGEVHLTTSALQFEFQKSASFVGDAFGFADSVEASARKWRAAYDANRALRPKQAQWWLRDGIYAGNPPAAPATQARGPQFLGSLEDE